jgi:F1F0 ATPase subunit 2
MTGASELLAALIAGVGLGAFFFGGLWWTSRKGLASRRPAVWFLGSFVVRTALTLAGFYAVSGGRWQPLTACLAGFFIVRLASTRWTRRQLSGGG